MLAEPRGHQAAIAVVLRLEEPVAILSVGDVGAVERKNRQKAAA